MTEFDKGIVAGVLIVVVVLVLVALFGCGVVGVEEPPVARKVVAESGQPPLRPPLPDGWRVEGDMWINELTGDTIRVR